MPATDYQGVSGSLSSLGRSLFSLGRDQVHSVEPTSLNIELGAFQKQVAERFTNLETSNSEELLSIPWIQKLLDVFICCQEEFRAIIFNNGAAFNKPPLDRAISEFFERSVKALDVCNAIRDGIEQIRQWQKQIEIVLSALDTRRSLGEGQFRRAKKALIDLVIGMLDEKESAGVLANRNWSFGSGNGGHRDSNHSMSASRSLSWSVSRSWSAARQLQAMASNLTAPRPNDLLATNGLVGAVFTMNYVLLFVMWALVAAIPCQDRGLQTHFHIPRHYEWANPILAIHERIMEDSKKRDRKNGCGLLMEIREVEQCVRRMNELMDSIEFPLRDEKAGEVKERVEELGMVYDAIKDGVDPLERQVREVFHRIVRSRTDCFDSIG